MVSFSINKVNKLFKEICQNYKNSQYVLLIVDNNLVEAFEKKYISFYSKKIIVYVLQLNYKTLPFLKMADFIIYQDRRHKELAELIMGFDVCSTIIALPKCEIMSNDKSNTLYIYSDYSNDAEDIMDIKLCDYKVIYRLSISDTDNQEKDNIKYINLLRYDLPVENFKLIFIEDSYKNDDIDIKIKNKNKTAIYYDFMGNTIHFILAQKSVEEYSAFVFTMIRTISNLSFDENVLLHKDELSDLNVVFGKQLNNYFVFSICYRNVQDKLLRCIESVCKQAEVYNFGIALVDDNSDVDITENIHKLLNENNVDHIIVRNKERKYASRNFYNVIHSLVKNDDSYIIELDGDDYLANEKVLDILYLETKKGILKSIGNLCVDTGRTIRYGAFEKERMARNYLCPRNMTKCSTWYHLRMTKCAILKMVEIEHFLERDKISWLKYMHDISVHSRAVELSGTNTSYIDLVLYVYDISGDSHDALELMDDSELDDWHYGAYLLESPYLFEMCLPIFEEPEKIPSKEMGFGLVNNLGGDGK
ncbi:glycosyltransferase [Lachnotalea glycerini]|uniref:Glycosyltransferase family 2 protein n=1 Tax=Lachnotalea glycerini TaxID=1763509 RepID=A0A371JGZ1_9FIRM|nr:glycosyltransferase [Lachnotalea glycerini]RDY32011.1 glycosyltransferase family 2 protein [Lachnotalea glycerini]